MSAITFDTLKFTKHLTQSGASPELANKADLRELEYRLTIRTGAMFITNIVVLSALYKLFG